MLKYSKQISQSEEVVMAPATAQLVQLTISSEIAKRQHIPVPDMTPAAQIVVEAGRSFTLAAEEEASHLSPECARQVRSLTNDLDLAGRDLMSVSNALRSDQSVSLRTALRDSCFQYNLIVMKILLSLDGQKLRIIKNCGEQLIAEIHSIPQSSGSMKTLVPLFKHFIEDLTQFCYRITDYLKEIKDRKTRQNVENSLAIIKRTPTSISHILQDKRRRSGIQGDAQLKQNVVMFVDAVSTIIGSLKNVDIDSATRYLELVLHASVALAGESSPKRRNATIQVCRKIIKLRSELAKLFSVTNQSGESWNHINTLSTNMGEAFCELNRLLSQTYTSNEYFVDESKPLLNLKSAAQKTIVLDSDPQLDAYIESFKRHANSLIDITEYAVQSCNEGDDIIPTLREIANEISVLAPKIIACALSVHNHPGQNVTLSFMNALCKEWNKLVSKLLSIIDHLTNSGEFLRASETHINQDAALSKQAFLNQDAATLQKTAKAMINRAQRVFQVGQKEILKSNNGIYTTNLEASLSELEQLLPRIVNLAQMAIENFKGVESQEELARLAQDVARAVHKIKTIVCGADASEATTQVDAAKELASALKCETGFFDIGVQTNMGNHKSTSEPNVLLQFVMKEDSMDQDDIDKLVGAKGIRRPPESIKDAIVTLADLIMTAMAGDSVEGSITTLAAHCGRIKDLAEKCHSLTDNIGRLRTIDFLVQEMSKLTPNVNDSARKVSSNTQDMYSLENLRWTARHWADSVIVLGKAFDDFGLASAVPGQVKKPPSLSGLVSAAEAGDKELTEAELDSISLRTTKEVDLASYCSAACLNSTVAQNIDENVKAIETVLDEMARTARALAKNPNDEVTKSQLEHVCHEWQELYLNLSKLIQDNQPDTLPDDDELGIPPSQVSVAFEQLVAAAKAGDRSKVQVLGNSLSAMATKMRRVSKPVAESERCSEYQSQYIEDVSEELLGLTPEVIRYALLVAADTHDKEFVLQLDKHGSSWVDKMVSLSNALEAIPEVDEDDKLEEMDVDVENDIDVEMAISPQTQSAPHLPVQHLEDIFEPIKGAGYRLSRQITVSEEGSELKEIKSVTTKLCDCLQVLTTTHDDINERYEMEDTIEDVKSTVNRILLMRPGQLAESVNEWLESIGRVTDHLDSFLQPLLDIVSSPRNMEYFRSAPDRVRYLVGATADVTTRLQQAVDLGLVTREKEQGDITLVVVTQSHVNKITPVLCEGIQVIINKANDPIQRTKFEAVKYQWATKFKLLTIALDDIFRNYCSFPTFEDRFNAVIMRKDIDSLLQSVQLIQNSDEVLPYKNLLKEQIAKLEDLKVSMEALNTMNSAQYLKLQIETSFAVYCMECSILKATKHITDLVPEIDITMIDDNNLSYDAVKFADIVDDNIDAIQNISKVASHKHPDNHQISNFNSLSSSLIESLIRLSDETCQKNALDFQIKYLKWLCQASVLLTSDDLETINNNEIDGRSRGADIISSKENDAEVISIDLPDMSDQNVSLDPKTVTEVSGSQTFSELHFSDREGETPEPTFGMKQAPIYENDAVYRYNDDIDKLSSILASDLEADFKDKENNANNDNQMLSRDGSMRSDASSYSPEPVNPLSVEYTDNPTQQAQVKDMNLLLSEMATSKEKETERSTINSIELLQDEVSPWFTENNKILLVTQKIVQHFLSIDNAIKTDSNSRAHIELIETATLLTDSVNEMTHYITNTLLPSCEHKMCKTDLEWCVETLPSLGKQFMITCTLVSTDPHGSDTMKVISKQVRDMSDCILKLIHVSYHVHLAGALSRPISMFIWRSVYAGDEDDDSVLV